MCFYYHIISISTEEEIGHLFSQIVLALHLVHSHNIVHRDLKSQNVFLTRTLDHVKLGDFGISKILASKSQAHSVVGTPCYISPELCEGKSYNQKSDIWSIGNPSTKILNISIAIKSIRELLLKFLNDDCNR